MVLTVLLNHPSRVDGIAYTSRQDDQEGCYAVLGCASAAIVEDHRVEDLDQDWFWKLTEVYGVGLMP